MQRILDWLFEDDETLSPRVVVGSGLIAYLLLFLMPYLGTFWLVIGIALVIVMLAFVCYTVLRLLLPKMDPRDPDADRFVVWGGTLLFVVIGIEGFGLWFFPGLVLGAALIWWRAPELLEVFPWFEGRDDHDVRHE